MYNNLRTKFTLPGNDLIGTGLRTPGLLRQPISTNKLIGRWDLSGNAEDTSGEGNNGTVNNMTFPDAERGYRGQMARGNGTSSSIVISDTPFDAVGSFTVTCWVKPNTLASTTQTRFYGKRDSGTNGWMLLFNTNGTLRCDFYANSGTFFGATSTGTVNVSDWIYIVMEYDDVAKKVQLYLNNIPDGNVTTAGSPTQNNVTLKIGQILTSEFDGVMALYRYYNSCITGEERTTNFKEGLTLLH